jgi:U3 small nucleolar RNA-associated protein 7
MATAGQDGLVKVWDCRNWKGCVREWASRGGSAALDWSAKGALATASGGTVNVSWLIAAVTRTHYVQIYTSPTIHNAFSGKVTPPLYLTHPIPHRPLVSARFAPFQDILTIGHAAGLSSILVPGSGEPNFDSTEADPFENKRARREREVKALLDKVRASSCPEDLTLR